MTTVAVDEFNRIEMRAGRVVRAEPFPGAKRPAYKLWIDFGPFGVRPSSARLTRLYRPEDLLGRLVVAVTNLPPRRVADFDSHVLVLGFVAPDGEEVVLLQPERDVPPGSRVA